MYQSKALIFHIKSLWFIFCLSSLASVSFAQSYQLADVRFDWNGKILNSPFAGGLVAPQFNAMDLDLDGYNDLVIFDRVGDIVITYLFDVEKETYIYAPEYASILPTLLKWVIIRDYNNDGVSDIFTGSVVGSFAAISCYKGSIINDKYEFELLAKDGEDLELLYYESPDGRKEIYNSIIDKPEILDLDNDGDVDIISFNPSGSKVDFYQNMTVEQGADFDEMRFEKTNDCYGGFQESGLNETILLSPSPGDCYTELTGEPLTEFRHAGSCITAFDQEGDGDYDLLIGDLTSNKIAVLTNGGTADIPWMNAVDYNFPIETTTADMPVYLAAYVLDVNQDGNNDVIISPNGESNVANVNNVWYYKNSTNSGYDLDFVKSDFLKDEMLDLGSFASARFVDVNGDGLADIVAGTRGEFSNNSQMNGRLIYFENVGTQETPAYSLVDFDFADYNQFSAESVEFAPSFGDLDGDNDIDMVVGDAAGYIYYSENIAGEGNPLDFANPIYQYFNIRPGQYAKPAIFDVNADGLADLVIGERNGNSFNGKLGSLNYYQNIGTDGDPIFDNDLTMAPNTPTLGEVLIKGSGDSEARSCPVFYETVDSLWLFSGSKSGKLHMYTNIKNNIEGKFDTVSANLGGVYEGNLTTIDVADIDMDGYLEMLVANERGGLAIHDTDIVSNPEFVNSVEIHSEQKRLIYPNPVVSILNVELDRRSTVSIFSSVSQLLITKQLEEGLQRLKVDQLQPGIYTLVIENNIYSHTQVFVKQ